MKIKKLFAIHRDSNYNLIRTKIAEGTTTDFADAMGFQVEDFVEGQDNDDSIPYSGLNGSYPTLKDDDFKHLEGKILTLCDATFTNKEQREAFKRIVSSTLWGYFHEQSEITRSVYNKSK